MGTTRKHATNTAANAADADAGCPHSCNPHMTGHVREGHPEQRAAALRHRRRNGYARQPGAQLPAALERRADCAFFNANPGRD